MSPEANCFSVELKIIKERFRENSEETNLDHCGFLSGDER
jgi:hypothetical protein